LIVSADVPERYLASLNRGDEVIVHLPILNIEQDSKIQNIGEIINPDNRTIKVEAVLNNPNGNIKPNLMAMVKLREFALSDAIIIPTNLIQNDLAGSYVYTVSTDKGKTIAKKTYLETGKNYGGETTIEAGLTGSEQLITDGSRFVSDNELIKVIN